MRVAIHSETNDFSIEAKLRMMVAAKLSIVIKPTIRYDSLAGWSSLVARWAHNPKVAGSNPAPAITYLRRCFKSVPKTIRKA